MTTYMRSIKEKGRKKKEERQYALKRTGGARVLRFLLWTMLVFLMIRGAVSFLRPDRTEYLAGKMEELEGSVAAEAAQDTEILAFVEEFAREWGTYTDEEEFKERLEMYVVPGILERDGLHDFSFSSEAISVNAYRSEEYAPDQIDVFVMIHVRNTGKGGAGDGQDMEDGEESLRDAPAEKGYTLKVPVQVTEEGKYIVEGIPLIVGDSAARAGKYREVRTDLQVIEDTGAYQDLVANFLEAYYGGQEQILAYYIAQDADKGRLGGLPQGGMELAAMEEVKVYREAAGTALCLAKYQIRDVETGEFFSQECSIRIDDSELGKLYIKTMDTKTINIRNTEG